MSALPPSGGAPDGECGHDDLGGLVSAVVLRGDAAHLPLDDEAWISS